MKWSAAHWAAAAACLGLAGQAQAQERQQPAAVPAAPTATPTLIPTEALANKPPVKGPALSPNGTRVVARLGASGKEMLGIHTVSTGMLKALPIPKGYDLVSYRWAGNERILASFGKTTPFFNSEVFMTRLVLFDLLKNTADFVGQKTQGPEGDDILYTDPSGDWLLLSIQKTAFDYPSVYRVDLGTLKMKQIVSERPDVWEWFADNRGHVRAGIGFSQTKWSMVYRSSETAPFKRIGSARYDDPKKSLGLLRFAIGSDHGFILSSEQTGRDAVYKFNFATLELGERLFESPTNDVSDIYLSDDGTALRAATYTDDRDRIHWFEPRMKELQADLDRAVKGREAWIVSRSSDDEKMLVLVTGANDPGSYYYFEPAAGIMRRIAYVNEKLKGYRLAPSRPVSYKARDGLTINAYLTVPLGREERGLPLIVMPHGGPFGVRDRGDYDPEVQLLANRGYAVLQPNFRGSESYGREFEDKAHGQWGRAMQDDLDDGMDWLVREKIADPKRVCIVGASYGGYAALWGATRNPERYRCAASFAGVTDLQRQLRYSRSFFTNGKSARKWQQRVRGDASFNLGNVSPIDHVARLTVPVLLAHGADDQRVPAKQSSLYAKALQQAGKPHEHHVYEGEGHGFSDPANLKDYLDRLEAFLLKHNPPG